ncbi:MAG: flavin reductase [Gammaproteobacteria bacterium]|nr:flavin reductase [Gammaproteobacteria bacterium]
MIASMPDAAVRLDIDNPIWERFFTIAPLVLIGTCDSNGVPDLAPKHMVTPLGWKNYFGFVCTPRHHTWRNIEQTERFSVSYPRPDQLLLTSLTASPRCDDDSKPILSALDTFESPDSGVPFLANSYLWLECSLDRIIPDFGENGLIAGRIVAAHAAQDALIHSDMGSDAQLRDAPLFAYIHPGRFAVIDSSFSFPFPSGMKK